MTQSRALLTLGFLQHHDITSLIVCHAALTDTVEVKQELKSGLRIACCLTPSQSLTGILK